MYTKMLIGSAWVEVDTNATKEWYERTTEWSCTYEGCRRFVELAKSNRLPYSALSVLRRLSVPPEKATYVCRLADDFNDFSYRIVGKIVEDNPEQSESQNECICMTEYPYPCNDFPSPHFDIGFFMNLPAVSE